VLMEKPLLAKDARRADRERTSLNAASFADAVAEDRRCCGISRRRELRSVRSS